ncbi:amino acid adenylation domain-containing protein [Streptomyces sp. WMMC940]|uniref:amino acid adenylation domain-containing protein n=1 Tax=Streptomyces sp. WMMC940 TaxID=3015153 RepID=UPI0022B5F279|nr:non-ribosomal peptide synthetase [Streptomyces sp. WMMC940]MCZ7456180.1 amino acid adenylation domain-containing protein [Streptomyces sp. WMMC940]
MTRSSMRADAHGAGHPETVRMVRARVERTPAAIALRTAGAQVEYAELWERAVETAGRLTRLGVPVGGVVALSLPSGPEAVVAMLGTWLAGAAFLPIDAAAPVERRDELVRRSRAAALLDAASWPHPRRVDPPPPEQGPEARFATTGPAYVIYTSGSTGAPKGVLVGHTALGGHVAAAADLFGLSEHDTVLQFASLGFDVAQEEIWPTLAAGGTLAFHGGGLPDAAALADLASGLGVTILQLPTAYWRMLCAELDGASGSAFAGVRTVVIGGENAAADDVRTHRRTPLAHTTLINGYGPTESVVTATALVLPPEVPVPGTGGLPIGAPVGDRVLHVLGEDGSPVAPGQSGELWVGGALLAEGYLHDSERTAERFVPDASSGDPEARVYRTGDIVVRRADGHLEFLGRADNQVKIRGHRVELDEVDGHLLATPGVAAAAAFTLDDGSGGQALAAALTGSAGTPDPEAVRTSLRQRVPAYLVPGRIVVLDRMPLTTSGKIDRRAAARAAASLADVTDRTDVTARALNDPEQREAPGDVSADTVAALLRVLLQNDRLGPDDDFLVLGGDSLMAMRVCARMRALGVPMRPADLLGGRTARAAFAAASGRTAPVVTPSEEPAGPLDLLPAQQRWLYDGELPERDHFCLNALFTVDPGPEAAARLARIAEALQRRHPALRTVLRPDGTAALAEPDGAAVVRQVDLTGVPGSGTRDRLEAELAAAQRSMSLTEGRVFQLLHAELGDGTARLLLTVHHFVLDGVSMGLLVDDLEALLTGGAGQPPVIGPRAVGEAMRSWAASPEARADASRWTERTRGFAPLRPEWDGDDRLPTLSTHRFRLPAEATRLVTHVLPNRGVAPHDFVLGSLVGGLADWTGDSVFGVDVYAHSRDVSVGDLDLSRTVGYVQSTFPAVLRWEGSGIAALERALAPLGELPERRFGFDALRFDSPVPGEREALSACPRPTVRLNFRGHLLRLERRNPGAALRPAGESFGAHRSPLQRERYLLMVEGDIVDGELETSIKYSTGRWSQERIGDLATAVEGVMRTALADTGDAPTGGVR